MEIKQIEVFSKEEFRDWLEINHLIESKVAVVLHKKHTGKSSPTHRELMEEAICFGWIDTTIKSIDKNIYLRNFSKRNKNSGWSDNTISYAKRLERENKMSPQGIKFFKEGLKKPTLDHGIPKNPSMPKELREQLNKNRKSKENFEKFTPSNKKMIYRWILSAKREETREKRILKTMEAAKFGKNPITNN